MKKFLLIDDHKVIRSGISGIISDLYNPCEISEACNTDQAAEMLKNQQYDLVLLDIQMPSSDSLGLMEYINTKYPETNVLIFSMCAEHIYAKRFLKIGAKGFLSKVAPIDEIKKAINLALSGRRYISDSFAQILADSPLSRGSDNPFERLSHREFEITSMLLTGISLGEVCKSLNLQSSTIGTHKSRIFEKLKINNILELKELATCYSV